MVPTVFGNLAPCPAVIKKRFYQATEKQEKTKAKVEFKE